MSIAGKIATLQHFYWNDYEVITFYKLPIEEQLLILKWRNSEKIRKWMYDDSIIQEENHLNFVKALRDKTNQFYWLVKQKGEYLGVINLVRVDWKYKNAFLGIYVNPEMNKKGIGTILMEILKHITFNMLEFHTLKLEVVEDNIRAIKLYEKVGFSYEGRLKEFIYKNNEWKDMIIMGIINK